MSTLNKLAKYTTIVADTGDLSAIARLKPIDATTNPSLITAAFLSGEHDALIRSTQGMGIDNAIDYLTIELGKLILNQITGRVSTEVDARLSFDTDATISKAHDYIKRYQDAGVDTSRILIKIAATWQGIKAAQVLEQEGIRCNLTLLFTTTQAHACADAGVTLISPFVGRITDFQKMTENKTHIAILDDMGVNFVKEVYRLYKTHGYHTEVMGASFRSVEQILALAGCDLLTISPALLDELNNMEQTVNPTLLPPTQILPKLTPLTAEVFHETQNNHPLNTLLLKGIDGFIQARQTLADTLRTR